MDAGWGISLASLLEGVLVGVAYAYARGSRVRVGFGWRVTPVVTPLSFGYHANGHTPLVRLSRQWSRPWVFVFPTAEATPGHCPFCRGE